MSKAELALYGVLLVGTVAGLAYDVPIWVLVTGGIVAGLVNLALDRRLRTDDTAVETESVRWPWQKLAFWIVLVSIAALGCGLAYFDAPGGFIAFVCGLALAAHAYSAAREVERIRELRSGTFKRGPLIEDWTLLGLSLIFCALGVVLLREDWRVATVTLAFFGGCALTFITVIRRKLRSVDPHDLSVSVVGGVNIYAEGERLTPIAFGCTVVGCVLYFVGTEYPQLFRLMGAFIALVGLVLLAMIFLGLLSRRFIRFEPQALLLGEKTYRYQIEWDDIAAIVELEYANNPFVALRVADLERIRVEPAQRRSHLLRDITRNNDWFNADIVLNAHMFGIDAPVLAAALARYANDREARQELAIQRLTAGTQ